MSTTVAQPPQQQKEQPILKETTMPAPPTKPRGMAHMLSTSSVIAHPTESGKSLPITPPPKYAAKRKRKEEEEEDSEDDDEEEDDEESGEESEEGGEESSDESRKGKSKNRPKSRHSSSSKQPSSKGSVSDGKEKKKKKTAPESPPVPEKKEKPITKADKAIKTVLNTGVSNDVPQLHKVIFDMVRDCSQTVGSFAKFQEDYEKKHNTQFPDGRRDTLGDTKKLSVIKELVDIESKSLSTVVIRRDTDTSFQYQGLLGAKSSLSHEVAKSLLAVPPKDGGRIDFVAFFTFDLKKNEWRFEIHTNPKTGYLASKIVEDFNGFGNPDQAMFATTESPNKIFKLV